MNKKFGLTAIDLETILSVLKKHIEVEEAIMFGSRAKGNYKNGSDVDIALKGKLSFETITHINYLLNEETTMPYKFDVLNYHTIQDKDLIEHINRAGICFYQYSNMLQH
jgi:predicted nucleotidyltransferase